MPAIIADIYDQLFPDSWHPAAHHRTDGTTAVELKRDCRNPVAPFRRPYSVRPLRILHLSPAEAHFQCWCYQVEPEKKTTTIRKPRSALNQQPNGSVRFNTERAGFSSYVAILSKFMRISKPGLLWEPAALTAAQVFFHIYEGDSLLTQPPPPPPP